MGFEPGLAPVPEQDFAGDGGRDLELGGLALEGLLEGDLEVVAHVGAALAPAAVARPPRRRVVAEEILEDVRHEVGEIVAEAGPAGAAAIGEGRMAEAVIGGALLRRPTGSGRPR